MTVFRMTAKAAPAGLTTLAVLATLATLAVPAPLVYAQGKAKPATAPAATAATAAIATTPSGLPGTAAGNASSVQMAQQIDLAEGKSTLMHLPYPAARLAVGDARVADVILINPSEVYMLGKATGTTNLILWNKANQATIIDISVGIDAAPLRQQFAALFPTERDIVVTVSGNALILSGSVADTIRAGQVVAVATAYLQRGARGAMSQAPAQSGAGAAATAGAAGNGGPGSAGAPLTAVDSGASLLTGGTAVGSAASRVVNMLSVAAPQQVMLEVKIAEVSKSLVDQLGASIGVAGTAGNWTYSLLSNLLTGNASKLDAFNGKNGNFATLDAQKRDGLVKILAEPTVMAISGQEASFLAGGKIYIPVAQDGTGGSSRVTLEEKEYGVAVKFTPTVLEGGRINLRVAPEVSEINREGIGISATGSTATAILPAFTTRRASTTVQLYDGQSFAIGGLIKNNVTTSIKAFPGLGEIPILGALFRSSDFQSDRTELVFIVTPHLARPLAPNPKLPTDDYVPPNRFDFFGMGKMEGRAPAPASTPAPAAAPAPAEATPAATGFDVK